MQVNFTSAAPDQETQSYDDFNYGDLFRPSRFDDEVFILLEDGAIQVCTADGPEEPPTVWSDEEMENDDDFTACVAVHGTVELKFTSKEK